MQPMLIKSKNLNIHYSTLDLGVRMAILNNLIAEPTIRGTGIN